MLSASRLFRWFSPGCAAEPLIAFSTVVGMPLCLLRTRLSERPEQVWPKKHKTHLPSQSLAVGLVRTLYLLTLDCLPPDARAPRRTTRTTQGLAAQGN